MEMKTLYCWSCKTTQLMEGKKDPVWGSILYKCPNCGFKNSKDIQPTNR